MSDLQAKLDALPKWPGLMDHGRYYYKKESAAALARLALAREWIGDTHRADCMITLVTWTQLGERDCTCGRDALLKEMEVPK